MYRTPDLRLRSRRAGFTLIELMVALAILAILLGIAAPSFREAAMNVRISAIANDLLADLALARSEAVKRNQPVFLCPSANGLACSGTSWANGWIVFADVDLSNAWSSGDTVIKARGALDTSNSLVSAGHMVAGGVAYVPYFPSGRSTPTGVEFALCDTRTTLNAGRNIEINVTGRPSVLRATCPFTPSV